LKLFAFVAGFLRIFELLGVWAVGGLFVVAFFKSGFSIFFFPLWICGKSAIRIPFCKKLVCGRALVHYALIHSTGSSFWLAADSIGRKGS
jgi:hypothetical protein